MCFLRFYAIVTAEEDLRKGGERMKKAMMILILLLVLAVVFGLLLGGCIGSAPAAPGQDRTQAPVETVGAAEESTTPAAAAEIPTPAPSEMPGDAPEHSPTPEKPSETPPELSQSVSTPQVISTAVPTEKPTEATLAPSTSAPAPAPTPAAASTPAPTAAPVHTHSWSETGHSEATCSTTGSITYTCSCGETKTESIPALGHDWQPVYVTERLPIYGEAEEHEYCNKCNADVTGITMKEHRESTGCDGMGYHTDWVWPIIDYEIEETLTGYKCSRCGETKSS